MYCAVGRPLFRQLCLQSVAAVSLLVWVLTALSLPFFLVVAQFSSLVVCRCTLNPLCNIDRIFYLCLDFLVYIVPWLHDIGHTLCFSFLAGRTAPVTSWIKVRLDLRATVTYGWPRAVFQKTPKKKSILCSCWCSRVRLYGVFIVNTYIEHKVADKL